MEGLKIENVRHRSNPVRFRTKKRILSQHSTFLKLRKVVNSRFISGEAQHFYN